MERQRGAIVFLIVMLIGAVLSTVGMMVASGVDQEGIVYRTLSIAALCFTLIVVFVPLLYPDRFDEEQNQSETVPDSSLV